VLRRTGRARQAGAPQHPGAGIDLLCGVGDTVQAGQALYRVHAASETLLQSVLAQAAAVPGGGVRVAGGDMA